MPGLIKHPGRSEPLWVAKVARFRYRLLPFSRREGCQNRDRRDTKRLKLRKTPQVVEDVSLPEPGSRKSRERDIPIPVKLVQSLKAWRIRSDKNCRLLFPTAGCQPKLDFLDCLKAAEKRAKLKPENFWRTSSARRSRPGVYGPASISARSRSGSAIWI